MTGTSVAFLRQHFGRGFCFDVCNSNQIKNSYAHRSGSGRTRIARTTAEDQTYLYLNCQQNI